MFGTISRGFEKAAVIVEMIGQRTKTAFFKGVGDAAFFCSALRINSASRCWLAIASVKSRTSVLSTQP